jgi:hypothetical protein
MCIYIYIYISIVDKPTVCVDLDLGTSFLKEGLSCVLNNVYNILHDPKVILYSKYTPTLPLQLQLQLPLQLQLQLQLPLPLLLLLQQIRNHTEQHYGLDKKNDVGSYSSLIVSRNGCGHLLWTLLSDIVSLGVTMLLLFLRRRFVVVVVAFRGCRIDGSSVLQVVGFIGELGSI